MSEKDKIKFIKLTKSQRKLLLADQSDFNTALDQLERTLVKYRDEVRKSRIENFAAEHNIEDAFNEGDWIFNIQRLRFDKQEKVTPPPTPAPPGEKKEVTKEIPGNKTQKKKSKNH